MLLIVLALIVHIIENYIHAFDFLLFEMQRFIISQGILIALLKKTIVSTILLVSGLACIFLFLLSYESEKFLLYAVTFFVCAGYCITVWDTTVMFLAGRRVLLLWNRAADISILLYLAFLWQLSTDRYKIYKKISSHAINWGLTICSAIAVLCISPVAANKLLKAVSLWYCIFCVSILLLLIIRKLRIRNTDCLMMFAVCAVGIIVSYGKMATLSGLHTFYKNVLPFLVMGISVFSFMDFYQRHRTGILFGRESNQKLHQLTRHKEKITELMVTYFQRPINLLKASAVKLEKNYDNYGPEQKTLLWQMDWYLNEIENYMKNIGEYSGIYLSPVEEYHVNINLLVVIKNALAGLENENIKWKYEQKRLEGDVKQNQIAGDPFRLIDANRKLLSFLFHYRRTDKLEIRANTDNNSIEAEFCILLEREYYREVRKICRQFKKKTFISSLVEQKLIPLSIAKYYIEQSQGEICMELEGERLKLSYRLPIAESESKEETILKGEAADCGAQYQIVLISTLPQQIELIEKYLMYEKFHIKIFSAAADALSYVESTKNINIIIVGDMFDRMDAFQLCMEIRKDYTLEEIPILMLSHERKNIFKTEFFLYVNDIIYEPFDYATLLQKLHSMIILQESVKESMLSRLDFLQAQMDPHFIFNTISTIMPLCIENPMEAYNLLGHFSQYLRGSLYHKGLNTTIELEQELELIQAYLNIQTVRFNHMIRYTLNNEVEETIKILPLIIEPIVENCVKHGRIPEKELSILLKIYKEEEGIWFIIEDNGRGMKPEKIHEIIQEGDTDSISENHSIGISNLQKRLQIYYQSVLHIESEEGKGTRVSFRIPVDSIG